VNLGEEGSLLLVEDSGVVIARSGQKAMSPPQAVLQDRKSGSARYGNGTISVTYRLSNASWRLVGVIPVRPWIREFAFLRRISLIVSVLVILSSVLISIFLSDRITKPFNNIVSAMESVGAGHFSQKVPDAPLKDIHVLATQFNRMVDEVNSLMSDLVDKEMEKTRAELAAFQARINPHFLYNTLEVIRGIARSRRVDPVVDIVKHLAKLFRYSINKNMELVSISDELQSVRNYVSIQEYRYGDRVQIDYQIQDDVLTNRIIKLVMQPLVENAFYHGVETMPGKAQILIAGYQHNGTVVLQVTDNGVGIEEEKLKGINERLLACDTPASVDGDYGIGIGMVNVNRRLRLHYGEGYGLRVSSDLGRGTTVEVRVPRDHEKEV
jgi:two-component system sensor histidine kinase YesM